MVCFIKLFLISFTDNENFMYEKKASEMEFMA